MDPHRIAQAFIPAAPTIRGRFGTVSSIQADQTATVDLAGGEVSGVRYLAGCAPLPGSPVFVLTDGQDLFLVDHMAAAGRACAPTVSRSTSQSIGNASDVAVSWAAVTADPWSSWSAGSPTRLTAVVPGRYQLAALVRFASNSTGLRSAWLRVNGSTLIGRTQVPALSGDVTELGLTTPAVTLAGGDYVELLVRQSSGGALNLTAGDGMPACSLIYLGP